MTGRDVTAAVGGDAREAARGRARQIEFADDESLQDRPVEQCGDNEPEDAGSYVWSLRKTTISTRRTSTAATTSRAYPNSVNSRTVSVT